MCEKLKVDYYRGSEEDVLLRVLEAHKKFDSDIIVELTGDCPLIDSIIMDEIISIYLENDYDYVSNSHVRSYPDGFDIQVFSTELLDDVSKKTNYEYDRENVSSYFTEQMNLIYMGSLQAKELFWPDLRVTLDDKGDYLLLKNIITTLHKLHGYNFKAIDVVNYLKESPKLLDLLKMYEYQMHHINMSQTVQENKRFTVTIIGLETLDYSMILKKQRILENF